MLGGKQLLACDAQAGQLLAAYSTWFLTALLTSSSDAMLLLTNTMGLEAQAVLND